MKFDVVSLGPARMDCFIQLPEEEVLEVCSIDRQRCMIELGFGEKIAVKDIKFAIGGNTGNNAVGLSRLGYSVAMVGAMGDGWTDGQALEILRQEKVDTNYIVREPGKTGFGVVINYQGERTIMSYYADIQCSFPIDPELAAGWMYITSMGTGYEAFYKEAVEWAKSKGVRIVFNPGTRQVKAGLEVLKYVYEAAEILFVNREEAAQISGMNFTDDIKILLGGLKAIGTKIVVITDGPAGAYVFDGESYFYMPIVDVEVVERTGSGDAFGSGFMAAYMAGKDLVESLRWGAVNSASVLGFPGPQVGLLDKEKMNTWLEKNASVVAKLI